MTSLISDIKGSLSSPSSLFSINPKTDYKKHIPKNAEELMMKNWKKTGKTLFKSIKKVGNEIEPRK